MTALSIEGRRIAPVRLIPFMTGWQIAPDELARILAKREGFHRIFLHSFHILPDGSYAEMLPKEWDPIMADLEILTNTLKEQEKHEGENYKSWRQQSIELLPGGAFIWLDELESAWNTAFSPERTRLNEERPGDRNLNLTPRTPQKLNHLILRGFESIPGNTTVTSGANSSTYKQQGYQPNTIRREKKKLDTQDMYKSWSTRYRQLKRQYPGKSKSWYANKISREDIGNGRSPETIRKHMGS